jgi:hypothetical protein|mmetsp:Transcript_43859/g.99143  ORF Transcript_43859/g.99143 Transcript_43859/m.99143 type:complete len:172 (-) Transcript_43859:331-846(-)
MECKPASTDPGTSYLCAIDHYEACALETLGCIGGCHNDQTQLKLFNFLDCFEGKHGFPSVPGADFPNATWLTYLEPCASKAFGAVTHTKVEQCASGGIASGGSLHSAWSSINAFTTRVPHEFFPWITVGPNPSKGAMMTGYDDCLLKAVCGNYTGSPPENCVHQPPSPKGC